MAWVLDSAHSNVKFQVRHMMISNVHGAFEKVSGTIDYNEAAPEKTIVDVKIDAASINTKDEKRDNHLKSPDFLDVEKHAQIEFKSTRVQRIDDNTAKLYGNLTIRDVSKPVVLDVEFLGKAKSPWGVWSAGFIATGKINREDWGLNWNVALETGGWLVSKDIKIEIDAEIMDMQPQPAEAAAA